MHIPDGFVNLPVAAIGYVAAASGVAYSVKTTNRKLSDKQIPLMGVLAAFIFAAQMLNFPVPGGTSGHLMGAALAAILLGPCTASLIMTSILIVQSLIFQDGGLMALGVNVFNMSILGSFGSYYLYRGCRYLLQESKHGLLIGSGLAAWFSVVMSAIMAATELGVSGTVPLSIALPAMGGIHALIGLGEALVTVAVIKLLLSTRADLTELQKA